MWSGTTEDRGDRGEIIQGTDNDEKCGSEHTTIRTSGSGGNKRGESILKVKKMRG